MRQSVLTPLVKLNDDGIKEFSGFDVSANRQSVLTPLDKLTDDGIKEFLGFPVSANQCRRIRMVQEEHFRHEKAGISTFRNDGGKSSLFGFDRASRTPNCSVEKYRKRWELFPSLKDPVAPIYEVYMCCGIRVACRGKQPAPNGKKKSLWHDDYKFLSTQFEAPDFTPKFRLKKQGRRNKGIREIKRDRSRNIQNTAHGLSLRKTSTFKANNSKKQLSCESSNSKESKSMTRRQLRTSTQNASAAFATPPTLQITTTSAPVPSEVSYSAYGSLSVHVGAAALLKEMSEKLRVVTAERDQLKMERDQEKMEKDLLKTENDKLMEHFANSFFSQSSV